MLNKLPLKILAFYQNFLSPFLRGNKCRYYPSCSEYSKQIFLFYNPFFASYFTLLRILRCNQFFKGGIDYPKVRLKLTQIIFKPIKLAFWLIPVVSQKFNYKNIILKNKIYPLQTYYIVKIFKKASRV